MTNDQLIGFVRSLPGTAEKPHFDRTAFMVIGKRNFVTLHAPSRSINVKLTPEEQVAFCDYAPQSVYPVPNKWGERGWTTIALSTAADEVIHSAVESAYNAVFPTK